MIILKSLQEIEKIRKACLVVAAALDGIRDLVRPGVSTQTLDEFAEQFILAAGARPAFKGYRGYPKTLCTSVNNEVIHGIPSNNVVLRQGDIVSIDVGAIVEGFYGDAAITLPVDTINRDAERLIRVTEESLYQGIEQAKVGNRLFDISHAVQDHVESHRYSVVREFVGHGIGRNLHEDPQIPTSGRAGRGRG
jgi:methionyl aminopeptidase